MRVEQFLEPIRIPGLGGSFKFWGGSKRRTQKLERLQHASDIGGQRLRFHGNARRFGPRYVYGSDAPGVEALMQADPELAKLLHPALPYTGAEVIWAVRFEMARTVEDVLA